MNIATDPQSLSFDFDENVIDTEITINGVKLSPGQALVLSVAASGFWFDLQTKGLGDEKQWQDLAAYYSEQLRVIVALFGPLSQMVPVVTDYSDELFPSDPDVRAGLPACPSVDALCDAVEVWLHARPGRSLITAGEAAAAFNVSVRFLIAAFDNRCGKYFYIKGEGAANASRVFAREFCAEIEGK